MVYVYKRQEGEKEENEYDVELDGKIFDLKDREIVQEEAVERAGNEGENGARRVQFVGSRAY